MMDKHTLTNIRHVLHFKNIRKSYTYLKHQINGLLSVHLIFIPGKVSKENLSAQAVKASIAQKVTLWQYGNLSLNNALGAPHD